MDFISTAKAISAKFNPDRDNLIKLCNLAADSTDFNHSIADTLEDICQLISNCFIYINTINTPKEWQLFAVYHNFPQSAIYINVSNLRDPAHTYTFAIINVFASNSSGTVEFTSFSPSFVADSELNVLIDPLTKVYDSAFNFGSESKANNVVDLDAGRAAMDELEDTIIGLECICRSIYERTNNSITTHMAIRALILNLNLHYIGYLAQDLSYLNMQVKV